MSSQEDGEFSPPHNDVVIGRINPSEPKFLNLMRDDQFNVILYSSKMNKSNGAGRQN